MTDCDHSSVVANDGEDVQPALDKPKRTPSAQMSLEPPARRLLEEEAAGVAAARLGPEPLEQFNDEQRDRPLLQTDRRVAS